MRIAVIGTGISGLTAAHLLASRHDVHVYEARERLGGHTHTVPVPTPDGRTIPVDTGFIVFNHATYPNFTRLLAELDVPTQASDMSFALSDRRTGFEYAGSGRGIIRRPGDLADRERRRLLTGVLRFNRIGARLVDDPATRAQTLDHFLRIHRLDDVVRDRYVLPMAAAIWSTGTDRIADFPAATLLQFFANHGLLGVSTHHEWRTVTGGSHAYLPALTRPFADRIRLDARVVSVQRDADAVTVRTQAGTTDRFDAVVIGAHADDALGMLADPSDDEKELLGAWAYSVNDVWLHTDAALMPADRRLWSSWNVLDEGRGEHVSLSYWMNRLQSLDEPTDWFVTLNPARPPAPEHVLRRMTYRHPVYDLDSVATQPHLDRLNGVNRTFFCGAHHRHGFHEDGVWSGLRVARHFGITW